MMPGFPQASGFSLEVSHSEAEIGRVRVKNRRKRYLDLHPEYFGPQLELAGGT